MNRSKNEQKQKHYYDFFIVINCLLIQLKANAVYYGRNEAEYKPRVQSVYRIARQHIFKRSHIERCDGINLVMCELWDLVEVMLNDVQQQAQKNQQSAKNQTAQCSGSQQGRNLLINRAINSSTKNSKNRRWAKR